MAAFAADWGGIISFLGRAELMFDAVGAMRRRHMDLEAKRHFLVTNWAVHNLGLPRNASSLKGASKHRLTIFRQSHKDRFRRLGEIILLFKLRNYG